MGPISNLFSISVDVSQRNSGITKAGSMKKRCEVAGLKEKGSKRTILRSPIKRLGIDKVRRCESSEPGTSKTNGRCDTERIRTEALRGDFPAGKPSIGGDHTIVAADVDY
jgi:hypothetical protein